MPDWAAAAGIPKRKDGSNDWAAAAGVGTGAAPQLFAGQIDQAAYQRAIAKRKAGQPLSTIEERAYTAMQASLKVISGAGVALQPFQAAGDITRGIISDVQADLATGQPFTHTEGGNRGMAAAVGHFTYGLSERIPGQAGARANGVTGEELLKGTKWAGNPKAGLWAEILTDPTIVFTGIGALGKGVTLTAKLASIEKLASTAAGRATINKALAAASKASGQALHLGDELTGLPTITRGVVNTGAAKVVKGAVSKLGDTTMPPVMQGALGVRTYGDAFFTPDVKAATYTPAQLARDHWRDTQRIANGDLGQAITTATVKDAGAIKNLTAGLKPADAKEVNRLLGVVTTATDPAVIAEVGRKLAALSTKYGKDLEKPFVSAVKAADNFSQNTIGRNLQAQGLPVILDPAVTTAVQKAQSLADLTPLIGKYANDAGRPRGILMTQYAGRDNPDKVIAALNAAEPTPASVTLDQPKIAQTVDDAVKTVEVPAAPMQPTGTAARTTPLPANTAEVASDVTASTPDRVMTDLFGSKDASVSDAAKLPDPVNAPPGASLPDASRTPDAVLADLFGGADGLPSGKTIGNVPKDIPVMSLSTEERELAELFGQRTEGPSNTANSQYRLEDKELREQLQYTLHQIMPGARVGVFPTAEEMNAFLSKEMGGPVKVAGVWDREGNTLSYAADNPNLDTLQHELRHAVIDAKGISMANFARDQGITDDLAARAEQFLTEYEPRAASQWAWEQKRGAQPFHLLDEATQAALHAYLYAPGTLKKFLPEVAAMFDAKGVARLKPQLDNVFTAVNKWARQKGSAGVAASNKVPAVSPGLARPLEETGKTPAQVLREIMDGSPTDPYIQAPAFPRTAQDVSKDVGLHVAPPERIVTKTVPTTYRTVQVDSSAVDWASLPDRAARTEVERVIGNGFKLTQDARGRYVPNKAAVTLPLDHPVVGRYFPDDAIEGARFGGDSAYGELTQATRQQVPDWFNPKDPAPLSVQRATRDAELAGRETAAYPNDYGQVIRNLEGSDNLDTYLIGEAFARDAKAGKPPLTTGALDFEANSYAQRVTALRGAPPTPAEVFRYRMQMARVQQAQRLQSLSGSEVTDHLRDFFTANPEATLYEATLSAAKQFGIGNRGAKLIRQALYKEESGFMRQMSSLEKKEFGQYILGRDQVAKGGGGGNLTRRLLRNPEAVSEQFKQLFPQEENALKLLTEQAKTRTGAILKADNFRAYHEYLTQSGQHLTERQLTSLRLRPINQLSPEERALRESIASATDQAGVPAGWKIMDRNAFPFQKGDAVPWWAHADLFSAGLIDDAAVSSRILQKGGIDTYNRLWSSMNAQMLSSPSSIVNDQVGMFQQMILWGIQPEQIVNGMIRRAAAATNPEGRAMLAAMRENGIASAKLESNLGVERTALEGLARRLQNESDMGWFQRNVDAFLRWREYGTGVDRGALVHPAAKVSADVMHLGSAYLFQIRSAMADLQRESLYFHFLSEGNAPKAAAAAANHTLMDMRLAPAYSKVVSKFWPFFRWTAMSAPRGILTVFRRPAVSHAYQSIASLSDTGTEDGKNEVRRVLARDGGYVNLGFEERGGSRVYLDPRNWDVENTIPMLLDWSGTKVGSVGLPWYANLWAGLQLGTDRNGNGVFSSILGTNPGGYQQAFAQNPKQANIVAAKYIYSIFAPGYAPGSSRAQSFAASVVETAKLTDDGSRDITIAKTLMGTEMGRQFVRYMQQGPAAFVNQPLTGNRGSPFNGATPSMARSSLNFLFPLRSVDAELSTQGDARQQISVMKLERANFQSQGKKQLMMMRANPATSSEALQAKIAEIRLGINRRNSDIKRLADQTR